MSSPSTHAPAPSEDARATAAERDAPSAEPVVAELLAGVRDARRALRRSLYAMVAVYCVSIAAALAEVRPNFAGLLSRFGLEALGGFGFVFGLLAVLFGLWLLNQFPYVPLASPEGLRRYLKDMRRNGHVVVVGYMASWCVFPHLAQLGWWTPSRYSDRAPTSYLMFCTMVANLGWLAVQRAFACIESAAPTARAAPYPPMATCDFGFRERLAANAPGAALFALLALPLPWLADSFGAGELRRATATHFPPIWACTTAFWIASALDIAFGGRSTRSERLIGGAAAVLRFMCLLFSAIALSEERPRDDWRRPAFAVTQVATMAAASLWLHARSARPTIAGEAALP